MADAFTLYVLRSAAGPHSDVQPAYLKYHIAELLKERDELVMGRPARRAERIEKAARALVHAARDLLERQGVDVEGELPELRTLEDALYTTPAEEGG